MYIEFHDHLGNPQRAKATRVVVYDDHGNPYVLAVSYERAGQFEQVLAAEQSQQDFQPLLRNMGINKTTVIQDLQQTPLQGIHFR